jgi:hypothetical protein
MVFEIWDVPTRNLVGTYESVDEALTDLRRSYDERSQSLDGLLLGAENDEGTSVTIAEGTALERLVVHHWPDRAEAV